MLNRLPSPAQLPPLSLIIDDIGSPGTAQIGRAIGVPATQVAQWIARDAAPRPAMLALYWLTRWGQSAVNVEAFNDARRFAGLADCQRRELQQLRAELARVVNLADFGCANAPSWAAGLPLKLGAEVTREHRSPAHARVSSHVRADDFALLPRRPAAVDNTLPVRELLQRP